MDETDIRLSLLLMKNSRAPYRELASKLDISLQAVHRRIQLMREMGVVQEFVTLPTSRALGCVDVFVMGRSTSQAMEETARALDRSEFLDGLYVAGGNVVFVSALLRDISELEALTEHVRTAGQVPEPRVGIMAPMHTASSAAGIAPLTELERRIIRSLHHDSRKSVTDIAEELGISARTVNRHIGRMAKDGLVAFTVLWFPCGCRDIFSMLSLELRPGLDKNEVLSALRRRYGPKIVFPAAFSNLPNFLLLLTWSTSPRDLEELQRSIEKEPSVESVMTDILYCGHACTCWRDRLIDSW